MHDTGPANETIWFEYTEHHQTIAALSKRFNLCEKTIRTYLDDHQLSDWNPLSRTMVAVADATKIGNSWVLVIRDPNAHENVYVKEVCIESLSDYQEAFDVMKEKVFVITAVVGDGRIMIPWLFPRVKMQMCHFHQEQIVIRYLIRNPELPAGQELLALIKTLSENDESSFTDAFNHWCRIWNAFLNEKTESLSGK